MGLKIIHASLVVLLADRHMFLVEERMHEDLDIQKQDS
jgi:hypothetical protein